VSPEAAPAGGRVALISGCSTGIGRATALRLDGKGWTVYAGVRKQEDADGLAAEGSDRLRPLILEVTDPDSIAACRQRLESDSPRGLHALVNNAGVAYTGPVEFIPLEDFRTQLEVNLIGHLAMTQAMIPALRLTKGRIVNVTSIGGVVATPFFSPYSASKFGLEAVSDALRTELRPWGIKTIAIEPGSIATEIWNSGAQQFDRTSERMAPEALALYGKAIKAMSRAGVETGARGIPVDHAAALIEKVIEVKRPRARYRLGRDAHLMFTAKRLLPDRLFDRMIARAMRLP
jgi:NAD(P)-dependent dehydrogenase (short-subunit alcohol dehydrogenase family)